MDFNLNSINGTPDRSQDVVGEREGEGWVNHIILYPVAARDKDTFRIIDKDDCLYPG